MPLPPVPENLENIVVVREFLARLREAVENGLEVDPVFISQKGQPNGVPVLDGSTLIPTSELGTGIANSTKFLRGDRTWQPAGGGGGSDIYAATFVVSTVAGQGTHTTIEAAVAAVPVGGADIYVHAGTWTPPVTINLPINRDVRIRGAGAIGITQITIPTTGGGSPSPLFSVAAGATAEYSFSGFKATGDNTFQQSLIKLSSAVEVSFEDVEVIDTRDIVVTSTTPEVVFTHCKITFTTFSTLASFWRGTGVGGKLVWNYVDATFNVDSTEAIIGFPDWTVTASYIGGPPASSIYYINVALWQGFNLDKAEVHIQGDGSRIVNFQGKDIALKINNKRTTIANSVFFKLITFDNEITVNADGLNPTCDVIVSGCTFDRAGFGGAAIRVSNTDGAVIDGCTFRNGFSFPILLEGGTPASKATVTGCRNEIAGGMVAEGSTDAVGRYSNNTGFSGSAIVGPDSVVEGIRRKDVVGGATTDAFVTQFTHENTKGLAGGGSIKNIGGSNTMTVRITAIDAYGTTDTASFDVAPGASTNWSMADAVGTSLPPFVSYALAVKSTTAGLPTTFTLHHATVGAY